MIRISLILLMIFFLNIACQDDTVDFEKPEETSVRLALKLIHDEETTIDTRAISQGGVNENGISDLNILIFDVSGNLLNQQYYTGSTSSVTITTTSGQRNVVAIANIGTSLNTITTLAGLNALYTQASSPSGMLNASKNLVMAKQTGVITIPAPAVQGGAVTIPTIYLNRLAAKITTTFSYSLNAGVTIKPLKITLCQVPNICYYLNDNVPSSSAQILARGDSLYNVAGIISADHTSAIPLYMYENKQGNNGTNTAQSQKTPATGKSGFCTYLEVTASYSSPTVSGPVVYRYYLGTNTLTNFDITRNTWYQISISFNGNGGITENSWRVNVAGLDNTILPSTLYIPYYSARSQIYNFSTTSIGTTLGDLSSSTQSAVIIDSTLYVMSKTDNGSSALPLGTATAQSKTYNFTMLPKGSMEFYVDVSNLDFPQNRIFGSKNYPITQYIQVFNTGSGVGTWTARSTASWLYIGNGSDFPAFSASGSANTWSTSSPVTPGSVMYSSATGVFTSSASNTSLAVRCDANTGNRRNAYIIFTAANNQEVARVYVTQNPSSYPKAPVGLRYIAGGVFRPGAFNSAGNVASPQPDGSSNSSLWIQIPSFYIAGRECSIQNFADYLNDLGTTDVATISGRTYLPLDKNGLLADYPGTLLTLLIANVFNPGVGAPSYVGNIWKAPNQAVKINGSSVSSFATASTGNFPMSSISFFGAYDYGYWAVKYSNVGTAVRGTTQGLPSDMQWEAAARRINNGFTTQAAFTGSSSTTKNGLFPYAFPAQTYNSTLNGTENTSIDILKSISLFSGFSSTATGTTQMGTTYQLPGGNLIPNSAFIYDLSGNVQEWTLDNYQTPLSFGIIGSFFTSPVNYNILVATRVVRGGYSGAQASYCSNVYRGSLDGNTNNTQTGFRISISSGDN